MTTRLCRSFQTAPAAVQQDETTKYLRSGFEADGFQVPDWFVPDLEDGTAPRMKDTALENTVALVDEYRADFDGEVWPRVQWAYDDESLRAAGRAEIETLATECGSAVDGVVVPKVGRVDDVRAVADAITTAEAQAGLETGTIELGVIVESAPAMSDIHEIAQLDLDGRLTALVFGRVDYTAELGGRDVGHGRPDWPSAVWTIANEASANDLLAIGSPFDELFTERAGVTVYDAEGYADRVEWEATSGLDGSWSLHPNQTVQANRIHMPTPSELGTALDGIEQFDAAKADGRGAVTVDGQMIDEATYKNYANTVRRTRTVHETKPEQTNALYTDDTLSRLDAVEA